MQYTRSGRVTYWSPRYLHGMYGAGDPPTVSIAGRWTKQPAGTSSATLWNRASIFTIPPSPIRTAPANGTLAGRCGRWQNGEEVVLATKFLPRTAAQIAEGISGKQAITRSLDQSLRNLGMDYIDLYIYHIWDYNTPVIDVLEALHTAVTASKVRAIGISNCYLAAGEGEHPCRTRRADILCFCAEPLQPDYM